MLEFSTVLSTLSPYLFVSKPQCAEVTLKHLAAGRNNFPSLRCQYCIGTRRHCVSVSALLLLLLQPFNGLFSGTTQVSRYQKGKTIWILLKQETVSGSGISWAVCKSAPRSRQITTPVPHHSVFCRPDALPAAQPTASKH